MEQSQSNLKKLLLQCEIYIQSEEYDKAQRCIEEVANLDLSGETKEDIKQAIDILEYIIKIAQEKRLNLAQAIANFNRFKDYIF